MYRGRNIGKLKEIQRRTHILVLTLNLKEVYGSKGKYTEVQENTWKYLEVHGIKHGWKSGVQKMY